MTKFGKDIHQRVQKIIGGASLASSLFGNEKIILIDDVDIFIGRKDAGGLSSIVKIIKESNNPIILTANNMWNKKLVSLRAECEKIEFKKVNKLSILKLLKKIAKVEGLDVDEEKLKQIAANASGDVRSALNDLQARTISRRERDKDIFRVVRGIFKAKKYKEVKELLSGSIDYNIIKLWIDENIPYEYEKKEDMANAYNWLSKSDVVEGRIKRTNWKLFKYVVDLATAGVALAKERPYYKFVKYFATLSAQ